MKYLTTPALLLLLLIGSCIKDDIVNDTVDPVLRITTQVDSIAVNTTYQFEYSYLNNIGVEEAVSATWSSSDPSVLSIDNNGLASALQLGNAVIRVEYNDGVNVLRDSAAVAVGQNTVTMSNMKSGSIATTSTYLLQGDFTFRSSGDDVILEFADNYAASTSLPGLYVYLTNNRNTTANALEIGAVQVFSGAHSYTIPNTGINDYQYVLYFCKPFNVKVGDGEIL